MSDRKTINVTGIGCIDFKYNYSTGTFVLEVFADKHLVKLHCGRWMLKELAAILWKLLRKEKQEIDAAEETLRTGE